MTHCNLCKNQYIERAAGLETYCCSAAEADDDVAKFFEMEDDEKIKTGYTECLFFNPIKK